MKERHVSKKRNFKELGSVIENLYNNLGLSEEFILGCIKNKWSQIVGEGISSHSEPVSLKDGELLVKVRSHLWAEEMRFQSELIIQKLKSYKIKNVKFRIGKINSRTFSDHEVKTSTPSSREISDFAESAVSSINDERLRDSIKKAMERSLSWQSRGSGIKRRRT